MTVVAVILLVSLIVMLVAVFALIIRLEGADWLD